LSKKVKTVCSIRERGKIRVKGETKNGEGPEPSTRFRSKACALKKSKKEDQKMRVRSGRSQFLKVGNSPEKRLRLVKETSLRAQKKRRMEVKNSGAGVQGLLLFKQELKQRGRKAQKARRDHIGN